MTINKYKETPPKTQAEIEDLAKAAAIARIYGQLTSADATPFTTNNNIIIKLN